MTVTTPSPQWTAFLNNLGIWEGSFLRLSPSGQWLEETPTRLTLAGQDNNQSATLNLQFFSPETGAETKLVSETFSSRVTSIPFFAAGHFSQGSIQFTPIGRFGAELAMIWGDRRLRMVQLFQDGELASHTVIREHRQDTPQPEYVQLTADDLVGEWSGSAVTIGNDGTVLTELTSQLAIVREGNMLHQTLTVPGFQFSSTAEISGNLLQFKEGKFPIQVLLLAGGGSSNTPVTVPRGQPFFLEAGWLVEPGLRQRLIRNYDDKGRLVTLTLVTEAKK
jgi:Domain of unknown function (DUF3598)